MFFVEGGGGMGYYLFHEFLSLIFSGQPLNFGSWILFAVPQLVLNLIFVWTILQEYFLFNFIFYIIAFFNHVVNLIS